MKYECSGCGRAEEPRAFRVEQGVTLVLTCAACGAETRATPGLAVPTPRPSAPPTLRSSKDAVNVVALELPDRRAIDAAASAATTGGLSVPDGVCPKCVTPKRPGASDCAACGLEFSRFDPASVAPAAWLAESWAGVLAAWGDPGAHEKVLGRAQQEGELPALARLYRLRLAAEPGDPIARRGCDEVVRRALLPSALAGEAQGQSTGQVLRMAAMGLFFVITLVALVWMARLLLSEPF